MLRSHGPDRNYCANFFVLLFYCTFWVGAKVFAEINGITVWLVHWNDSQGHRNCYGFIIWRHTRTHIQSMQSIFGYSLSSANGLSFIYFTVIHSGSIDFNWIVSENNNRHYIIILSSIEERETTRRQTHAHWYDHKSKWGENEYIEPCNHRKEIFACIRKTIKSKAKNRQNYLRSCQHDIRLPFSQSTATKMKTVWIKEEKNVRTRSVWFFHNNKRKRHLHAEERTKEK